MYEENFQRVIYVLVRRRQTEGAERLIGRRARAVVLGRVRGSLFVKTSEDLTVGVRTRRDEDEGTEQPPAYY